VKYNLSNLFIYPLFWQTKITYAMKKSILLTLLFVFTLCLSSVFADRIVVTGKWGDDGIIRSVTPKAPEASVNGNIVSIDFTDAISGLNVKITDYNGNTVYENVISGSNGESYTIPCTLGEGEYTLTISHYWGFLSGTFTVY